MYTDQQVNNLLEKLNEMNLLESSLVIITSDHGEEFQEHGMVLHEQVYEELIHVPLIVRYIPGKSIWRKLNRFFGSLLSESEISGRRIKTPVQHVDITPTVIDFLDLKESGIFQGRSLVPMMNDEPFLQKAAYSRNGKGTQYAMVDGIWKLVYHPPSQKQILFNLSSDPLEAVDLSGSHKEKAEAMKKSLYEWRKESLSYRGGLRSKRIEIDQRTRDELKALGYIQ